MEGIGQVLNACVIAIALGVVLKGLVRPRQKKEEGSGDPLSLIPKAFFFLKKPKREGVPLRVLGSVALGLKERVFLLEAEGKRFLLAANRGQVSILYAFEGETKAEPPREEPKGATQEVHDFAFPFPLPLEGGPSNGSRLKPFSEVVREIEREYPFLKGFEGWER